jgi:hypothetical protein
MLADGIYSVHFETLAAKGMARRMKRLAERDRTRPLLAANAHGRR